MGVASAVSMILFAITIALSFLIFRTAKHWVNYDTI